jgi:hypothetical protein
VGGEADDLATSVLHHTGGLYQCGVSYACELGPRSAVVCSASIALSVIMQVVVTIYVCGNYEVTVE